jgi:dolichol-phosphate mannosyltransferase
MIRLHGKHPVRARFERSRLITRRAGVAPVVGRPSTGPLPANPRSLIVIPTYNERESIGLLLREVRRLVDVDVLVIDDSSPDGTADIVAELRTGDSAIQLLVRPRRLGLASAYITGFAHAVHQGYDLVFEMDADWSHSPRYLPLFLQTMDEADLVVGSRYVPGGDIIDWHWLRHLISRCGNLYARTILGSDLRDLTSGFKCFRVSALQCFDLSSVTSDGYCFQIEMSHLFARNGLRVVEIPIVFDERRAGQSKMSWRIVLEAVTRVWALRFTSSPAPLRNATGNPRLVRR